MERLPIGADDLGPVDHDRAPRRRLQANHRLGDRGLAAAGLPDQPERLAGLNVQRDAIDGAHRRPAAGGVVDREIAQGQRRGHAASAPTRSACQHAERWPAPRSASGGCATRH